MGVLVGFLAAVFLIAFGGLTIVWARRRRTFSELAEDLARRVREGPATRHVDLPQIVRAFAEKNGGGANVALRALVVTQAAELKLGRDKPWVVTPAMQHIGLGTSAFVWSARQGGEVVPKVTVIDSFVGGRGLLQAAVLGAFRVAHAEGPVADRAEAMRYLAELPWAPDAILGNPEIEWRVVGDNMVEAVLPLSPNPARVSFRFGDHGDILEMHAEDRPEEGPDGTIVSREWRGLYKDYQRIGGRRIPTGGEVGYVDDFAGYDPYWRGRITAYQLLP